MKPRRSDGPDPGTSAPAPPVEWAPEYSPRERGWRLAGSLLLLGALFWTVQAWVKPGIRTLFADPPCTVLGLEFPLLASCTIFVGLPLLHAVFCLLFIGTRGYRILRDGQIPYKGEKVSRPTVIRRGGYSRVMGWMHFMPAVGCLALAIWGYSWLDRMQQALSPPRACGTVQAVGADESSTDRHR